MGLCSTQANSKGIVLRAAVHWGRNSSVVNDPLVEPGRTPLYVDLLSVWGCAVTLCFFPICRRAPFWGLLQTYVNE